MLFLETGIKNFREVIFGLCICWIDQADPHVMPITYHSVIDDGDIAIVRIVHSFKAHTLGNSSCCYNIISTSTRSQ